MITNVQVIKRPDFIKMMDIIDPKVVFSYGEFSTIPRMNKGGRSHDNHYYDKIIKETKTRILIGMEFEQRIKTKKPDYVVGPNKVFDIHKNVFIGYNSRLKRHYLKYEWFEEVPPTSTFYFEGSVIDKKIFEKWLVVSGPTDLHYQCINVDNIRNMMCE